jgi:DUF971 family protein
MTLESLTVIGDELAIRWSDQTESYVALTDLRRACPCAQCAGEADLLQPAIKPTLKFTPASFSLRRCSMVGGYGIQPEWADGHGSGIFSYELLRKLAAP